jgi:hypothetical protein
VGGTGVSVGGMDVAVGGAGVSVGDTGVALGIPQALTTSKIIIVATMTL